MSDIKKVKSNRELYNERLKAKYPDREFADDEAIFGQINDDFAHYEQELSGYQEYKTRVRWKLFPGLW